MLDKFWQKFTGRPQNYESVKQFEEVLWEYNGKRKSLKQVISFAEKGIAMFPIEKSYVLYYDICKFLSDTPHRFDWLYNLCRLLMHAHRVTGDALGDSRYKSYFRRATFFCGLEHKYDEILKMCQTARDDKELRVQLERIWQYDRRRPHWRKKDDPLLSAARAYVRQKGVTDAHDLRFNVGSKVIGHNRAMMLIDLLEEEGTIAPKDNPNWN